MGLEKDAQIFSTISKIVIIKLLLDNISNKHNLKYERINFNRIIISFYSLFYYLVFSRFFYFWIIVSYVSCAFRRNYLWSCCCLPCTLLTSKRSKARCQGGEGWSKRIKNWFTSKSQSKHHQGSHLTISIKQ